MPIMGPRNYTPRTLYLSKTKAKMCLRSFLTALFILAEALK